MRIEIRGDSVLLDGYVNAVCRDSRPIRSPKGQFIEQVKPKVFERALEKAENVDLLLNHNKSRKLGSTKEGNIELFEDNIGLRAICTVTDPDVIEKARSNKLRGWSFGMYVLKDTWEDMPNGLQRRILEEIEITEVSIIDTNLTPIYMATSIEQRGEEEVLTETREETFRAVITEETAKEKIDYSKYEKEIEKLKS